LYRDSEVSFPAIYWDRNKEKRKQIKADIREAKRKGRKREESKRIRARKRKGKENEEKTLNGNKSISGWQHCVRAQTLVYT
jgi:hypothetical protein